MDIDGCLADFNSSWLEALVVQHNRPRELLQYRGIHSFPFVWSWDAMLGFTEEEIRSTWEWAFRGDFFDTLAPLDLTRELLAALGCQRNRHKVVFCTHRNPAVEPQTIRWLERHGYLNPVVVFEDDKAELAKTLNATLVVEDRPSTLADYMKLGDHVGVVMPAYGYNVPIVRHFEDRQNLYSCRTPYQGIVKALKGRRIV